MTGSRSLRRTAAAAILAAAFLSPAACEKRASAPPPAAHPASARPAAPDFTLKSVDGKTVTLSQLRGKPVFLDFWATWCGPCRMSMPSVEKLRAQYGSRLQVLGMNVDEDPSVVSGFIASMGVSYTTLLVGSSGVDAQYQVSGIPAFFLIDADGKVAGAWIGYDESYADAWRQAVDGLSAKK